MLPLLYYLLSNYNSFYLLTILYFLYYVFVKLDPPPICGIYAQPGKWYLLKYYAFLLLLKLRRWRASRNATQPDASDAGYGVKSRKSEEDMDCVQPIRTETGVDAVYFNAADFESNYLMTSVARRSGGVTQSALILRLAEQDDVFSWTVFPQSDVEAMSGDRFHCGGLVIEPKDAMKSWHISYKGEMKSLKTGDKYSAEINLTWTACSNVFDFDTDMLPQTTARAIGRETWSQQFFETLKANHQTHYEQFGDITGTIVMESIDGTKLVPKIVNQLKLRGVRDHSYGNHRDWKDLHRYMLNYVTLEDGTNINASLVSAPGIGLSFLELGFVADADGKITPIQEVNLPLFLLGEDRRPPNTFFYFFKAGGRKYEVSCEVIDRPSFLIGSNKDAKVVEQMCRFVVDGKEGVGFSEWMYRGEI